MNFEEIKDKFKKKYKPEDKSFDPTGSSTGVPEDEYEKPIQDADDL